MNNNDIIKEMIKKLSVNEGMDESSIRKEIALAISLFLKSEDTKLQRFWLDIPSLGDAPTIDEITDYIILEISKEQQSLK